MTFEDMAVHRCKECKAVVSPDEDICVECRVKYAQERARYQLQRSKNAHVSSPHTQTFKYCLTCKQEVKPPKHCIECGAVLETSLLSARNFCVKCGKPILTIEVCPTCGGGLQTLTARRSLPTRPSVTRRSRLVPYSTIPRDHDALFDDYDLLYRILAFLCVLGVIIGTFLPWLEFSYHTGWSLQTESVRGSDLSLGRLFIILGCITAFFLVVAPSPNVRGWMSAITGGFMLFVLFVNYMDADPLIESINKTGLGNIRWGLGFWMVVITGLGMTACGVLMISYHQKTQRYPLC